MGTKYLKNNRNASRFETISSDQGKGEKIMKKFFISCLVAIVACLLALPFSANAEEKSKKLDRVKSLDSIAFYPDGTFQTVDMYINMIRPGIQFWLDEEGFNEYARSIRYEANFLLCGAGENPKEIETRVRNKEGINDFFRRAFCTEIERTKKGKNGKPLLDKDRKEIKESFKHCVGDPSDFTILVVRKIVDGPNRNTSFLFTYINKEVAYELGCRDEDIVEYVKKYGKINRTINKP